MQSINLTGRTGGERTIVTEHGSRVTDSNRNSNEKAPISEGAQEFEERFLIAGFELFKFFGDILGFAAVAEDGVE